MSTLRQQIDRAVAANNTAILCRLFAVHCMEWSEDCNSVNDFHWHAKGGTVIRHYDACAQFHVSIDAQAPALAKMLERGLKILVWKDTDWGVGIYNNDLVLHVGCISVTEPLARLICMLYARAAEMESGK